MNIILVAGGSGGHIYPAVSVAETLIARGHTVCLCTGDSPREQHYARSFPGEIIVLPVRALTLSAVRGGAGLKIISDYCKSFCRAGHLTKDRTPDVVIGFGGVLSVIVLLAARFRSARTMLHEQNIMCGRANRFLSRVVDRCAFSFEDSAALYARRPAIAKRVCVTGNPVRTIPAGITRQSAAQKLGLDPEKFTIVVTGGSLGARSLNELFMAAYSRCVDEGARDIQVFHCTGEYDHTSVCQKMSLYAPQYIAKAYCDTMYDAYFASDLVITRAGAGSISELAVVGRAAVMVPYPYAGQHQVVNARYAVGKGAACMIEHVPGAADQLAAMMQKLRSDDDKRRAMASAACALMNTNAAERVAEEIEYLGKK